MVYMVTFTIFYHQYTPNVSIYTILVHGSYGIWMFFPVIFPGIFGFWTTSLVLIPPGPFRWRLLASLPPAAAFGAEAAALPRRGAAGPRRFQRRAGGAPVPQLHHDG